VVVDAVKSAISSGLVEKGRDVRDENKLDAPIGAVKGATNSMTRAVEALTSVASDPEFDAKRRNHWKRHSNDSVVRSRLSMPH